MRSFVLVLFFSISFSAIPYCHSLKLHKLEGIEIEEILKNDALVQEYIDCFLDKIVCTEDKQELKDLIPDIVTTGCETCNASHLELLTKVTNYLMDHRMDEWKQLGAKYGKWFIGDN